ncbi:hypothetical protein CNMCM8694_001642 [Aspergillus lentulus]|nr:hypothetical protein CNMCM8694_001642 [Aspergillus lentulus]
MRTMDLDRLQALEKIDPTPLAPWRTPAFTEIDIEPDREKAKENASARQKAAGVTVLSNASGQQNHLGAAAVALDQDGNITQSRQISVDLTEEARDPRHWPEPATILTDSMSALQVISNSWNKSGQRIIQAILQSVRELNTRGIPLRLQWAPGHCDDRGNDTADRLAKEAVGPDKLHPFQHLLSREKGYIRRKIREEWGQEWKVSKKGGHLRQIDATLPSIRTRWMYGLLPRSRAYLLTQLRTGHLWLAAYGKRHGLQENDKYRDSLSGYPAYRLGEGSGRTEYIHMLLELDTIDWTYNVVPSFGRLLALSHLSLQISLGLRSSKVNSISGDGVDWNGDYHRVGNPPVSVMSQIVELRKLESMVSTGWQSCSPFESLRYLEIRQLSDGLLKIPAARALQELTVSFDPDERREPCDILLNLSQLPRLTTLRICHLLEGGLTVTGKSRSVKHLELVDSSIDGDEVFPRLSSSLESISTEGASMRGDLERGMRFPCLRFVEVEGNLSLLPLILFSSTATLKSFIVHYDHELDWDGLEKILNEFPPGGKPPLNCIIDVSQTVTLSDHDGSLALFLKLGRNIYARYVNQYCSGW